MSNWFGTNKGWLLPSIVVTGTISLVFFYTLNLQKKRREEAYEPVPRRSVETALVTPVTHHEKKHGLLPLKMKIEPKEPARKITPKKSPPVVRRQKKPLPSIPIARQKEAPLPPLKLSPAEVIRSLEGLTPEQRKDQEKKFLGRHVVWPVYLFSGKKQGDDKFSVTFDSSPTGFGVIIVAEIDLFKYIGIVTARQGDRIRLAGTITAIDTSGTGQIGVVTDAVDPSPVDRRQKK